MKNNLTIFLIILSCFLITGCDSLPKLEGKYASGTESNAIYSYYDCDGEKCQFRAVAKGLGAKSSNYNYNIIKISESDDDELKNNEEYKDYYIIEFTEEENSDNKYIVLYDAKNDIMYDKRINYTFQKVKDLEN